jgi:hypothetical protein
LCGNSKDIAFQLRSTPNSRKKVYPRFDNKTAHRLLTILESYLGGNQVVAERPVVHADTISIWLGTMSWRIMANTVAPSETHTFEYAKTILDLMTGRSK